MKYRFILLISACLISSLSIFAQEEQATKENEVGSIATDRPVQSETPNTVPKKHIQVEMGGQYTKGILTGNTKDQYSYDGAFLLKYGLFEHMELRLNTQYITATEIIQDLDTVPPKDETLTASGWSSPQLGFKFKVLTEDGWKPNIVLSTQSRVPIWGDTLFKTSDWNYQVRATFSKTIIGSWYVILGAELNYLPEQTSNNFYVLQTGYTFFDKLTAVAEFYGYTNPNSNEDQRALNYALVYLLSDNHQVDLSAGNGLGDNFYNYYVAVGYSFRLHH